MSTDDDPQMSRQLALVKVLDALRNESDDVKLRVLLAAATFYRVPLVQNK